MTLLLLLLLLPFISFRSTILWIMPGPILQQQDILQAGYHRHPTNSRKALWVLWVFSHTLYIKAIRRMCYHEWHGTEKQWMVHNTEPEQTRFTSVKYPTKVKHLFH